MAIFGSTKNIVSVATAFNISQPYLETNYTMPTFSQCSLSFSISLSMKNLMMINDSWHVDIAGNTTTRNITSTPNSTGTGTVQTTRPSDSSNVATRPGNNNNLGANNRATNNAVGLGLNVRGVVKVFGAFLLAGAGGVVGVGFLG